MRKAILAGVLVGTLWYITDTVLTVEAGNWFRFQVGHRSRDYGQGQIFTDSPTDNRPYPGRNPRDTATAKIRIMDDNNNRVPFGTTPGDQVHDPVGNDQGAT